METTSNTRTLRMLDNNIVEIVYFDNVTIDLQETRKNFDQFQDFTHDKPMKKLIISGHFTEITPEASRLIRETNKQLQQNIIAEAIVVYSTAQRIFAELYYSINKSDYPIQLFTNVEEAKNWLRQDFNA